MWRESFEFGVGVVDTHPLREQFDYFWSEVVPKNTVIVAMPDGALVRFATASAESVAQL